jgi:hypothetical protein
LLTIGFYPSTYSENKLALSDLQIHPRTGDLMIATHGRSIDTVWVKDFTGL